MDRSRQNDREVLARRVAEQQKKDAQALAERLPTPPDRGKASEEEERRLWYLRDPQYADRTRDAETFVGLAQQGLTDEQITEKVYPHRFRLLRYKRPELKDQVAFANRMLELGDPYALGEAPPIAVAGPADQVAQIPQSLEEAS